MHYRLDYILKLLLYTANIQTYVHLLGIYVSHIIHKQYLTKIKHYYNKYIEPIREPAATGKRSMGFKKMIIISKAKNTRFLKRLLMYRMIFFNQAEDFSPGTLIARKNTG